MTSLSDSAWSAASSALCNAVLTRDLRAARRALFEGAQPMQVQPGHTTPYSAFWLSLLGSSLEAGQPWTLDLPMIALMLDHGADPNLTLPSTSTPLKAVSLSLTHNAGEGIDLLQARGARVTLETFFTLLGDVTGPAPVAGLNMLHAPVRVLNALWAHADVTIQRTVLHNGPILLAMAHAKRAMPWGQEGVAMAQWLLAKGATAHTEVFPPIVRSVTMPPVTQVTQAPVDRPPEPSPTAAIILPFRHRPR